MLGIFHKASVARKFSTLLTAGLKSPFNHPTYGQLYGPFLRTSNEQTCRKAIETRTISANEYKVLAYYPNLKQPLADYKRYLDYLSGVNPKDTNLTFYTALLPNVDHHQLDGLAVSWPEKEIPVVPALSNVGLTVEIHDQVLFEQVRKEIQATIDKMPLKDKAYYST